MIKLRKIITSSIFIGLRPFLKREFTNFVGYNFASGLEFGLCSEGLGLWLTLSAVHGKKVKKSHNQKQTVSEPKFLVIQKIITRSFFIRLRPFFLHCSRNSVTDVFTEGSESRFYTEQGVVFTGAEILPLYLIFLITLLIRYINP